MQSLLNHRLNLISIAMVHNDLEFVDELPVAQGRFSNGWGLHQILLGCYMPAIKLAAEIKQVSFVSTLSLGGLDRRLVCLRFKR